MAQSEGAVPPAAPAPMGAREFWQKVDHFPKEIIRKLALWDCAKLDEIIIESLETYADLRTASERERGGQVAEHLEMANSRRDEITQDLSKAEAEVESLRKELEQLRADNELLSACPVCGGATQQHIYHKGDCRLAGYNLPQIYCIFSDLRTAERQLGEMQEVLRKLCHFPKANLGPEWKNIFRDAEALLSRREKSSGDDGTK